MKPFLNITSNLYFIFVSLLILENKGQGRAGRDVSWRWSHHPLFQAVLLWGQTTREAGLRQQWWRKESVRSSSPFSLHLRAIYRLPVCNCLKMKLVHWGSFFLTTIYYSTKCKNLANVTCVMIYHCISLAEHFFFLFCWFVPLHRCFLPVCAPSVFCRDTHL